MVRTSRSLVGLAPLVLFLSPALAFQSEFIDLGSLTTLPATPLDSVAVDVSADGATVIGRSMAVEGPQLSQRGFRWRRDLGMRSIGVPSGALRVEPQVVSPDGGRIGGYATYAPGTTPESQAMTWNSVAGATSFAPFVQSNDPELAITFTTNAGTRVVGRESVWDSSGTTQPMLGSAPFLFFVAHDASDDANTVVGTGYEAVNGLSRAMRWQAGTGALDLGLPHGWNASVGTGISADGQIIVGYLIDASGATFGGFRWTQATGMIGFGPGGQFEANRPLAVSAGGDVVAFDSTPPRFWTATGGTQDLTGALQAGGATLPTYQGVIQFNVTAMSSDGNAFVGRFPLAPGIGHAFVAYLAPPVQGTFGSATCSPAVINSAGTSAALSVQGSVVALDNDVALVVEGLPMQVFGLFLNSRTQGFVANPAGSQGNLCLGGNFGRYLVIQASGTAGRFELELDLTATPTPSALVNIVAGESWTFQAWYRDVNPNVTSNFSDSRTVRFD